MRPLSRRQLVGLVALDRSATAMLTDEQLRGAIGHHATNVITALQNRALIQWHDAPIPDGGWWVLTKPGLSILRRHGPKPPPRCPTCGQTWPR